jgi:glycine dehydrogenase
MAMQTREQHIRRDKATSNICTAQALLANMASLYGVYHGPEGIKAIATRIHHMTVVTAQALQSSGYHVTSSNFFDTFVVDVGRSGKSSRSIQDAAIQQGVNIRVIDNNRVGISFGESITKADTIALLNAFEVTNAESLLALPPKPVLAEALTRTSSFMTHPVFNTYHSESMMLRYMKHLESKDLSLNFSMISLGSCTMKLNATSEMIPVTWPETANLHPFAPVDQVQGYIEMITSLNRDLAEITGFAAVSTQPNSGAQVRL